VLVLAVIAIAYAAAAQVSIHEHEGADIYDSLVHEYATYAQKTHHVQGFCSDRWHITIGYALCANKFVVKCNVSVPGARSLATRPSARASILAISALLASASLLSEVTSS
jgi:hypothetical protein